MVINLNLIPHQSFAQIYFSIGEITNTVLFKRFFYCLVFSLISILLLPFHLNSQTISVETKLYNDENGLSQYANFIHKDSRGIIWTGTQYGLYRLDGQEFEHFDEKNGLPFRQIMEIYEDAEGWFWLYKSCKYKPNCIKDLAFFHPITREVLTFEQRFGNKVSITSDQIACVRRDSSNFYFTADRKLLIWNATSGIREIPIEGLSSTPIIFYQNSHNVFGAYVLKCTMQT